MDWPRRQEKGTVGAAAARYGGAVQNFRNLQVWQRAQRLAARVHLVSESVPAGQASWRNQMRRSSQSIAANIAEGAVRDSARQFAHFLSIAIASASETENHLDFAWRIGALSFDQAGPLLDEVVQVRRMLTTLRKRVMDDQGPVRRLTDS